MMISAILCFNCGRFEWHLVARGLSLAEEIINDWPIFLLRRRGKTGKLTQCPNTEAFLARIFLYSD